VVICRPFPILPAIARLEEPLGSNPISQTTTPRAKPFGQKSTPQLSTEPQVVPDAGYVCKSFRMAGVVVPILMLTARGQTIDKVLGLKIGADDYLTKPFDAMELLARIEALLRRANVPAAVGVHRFGSLQVNLRGTSVNRGGKVVPLSAREFQLLRYFVEHPGTTLSRDILLKEVWAYSTEAFTRTVDVHVASLRQKLEEDPKKPSLIVTVPGLGYKFAP
jgi:two-component system, OmpR family, alkaline phosphatase synthesis response regulator PhoP